MINITPPSTPYDKFVQELRRGVLSLAALSQLEHAMYGYALINELTEAGLDIDQGTLYPLLRRLEVDGLLKSEWVVDGPRPRRYYVISPAGQELLQTLSAEWRNMTAILDRLLPETKKE